MPSVDYVQHYTKNANVYNKKFDFEINPVTNWVDPVWLVMDSDSPEPQEQDWFIAANLGRENEIWECFYLKTYRRHKGHWCWVPYESMGRTYEEALRGLQTATKLTTPLVPSYKWEYDYLLQQVMEIDREYNSS